MELTLSSISHSGMSTFNRCALKFLYDAERTRKPLSLDERWAAVPSGLHIMMEKWFKGGCEGSIAGFAEEVLARLEKKRPMPWDPKRSRVQAIDDMRRYGGILQSRLARLEGQFYSEQWIAIPREDLPAPLKGALDLVQIDDDRLVIWDLKVTKNARWLDWKQLLFYCLLYEIKYHRKPTHIGFILPKMGRDRIARVPADASIRMMKQVRRFVDDLEGSDFQPQKCDLCYMFCAYRVYCPLYTSKPIYPKLLKARMQAVFPVEVAVQSDILETGRQGG